jgi:pseudouridine-5'-phosphate glycosidase
VRHWCEEWLLIEYLKYSNEVVLALGDGRPVVALESTLITHGLPHPTNVETVLAMEAQVRSAGAVPATVAVLGGLLRVGLDEEEIRTLATADGVLKVSSRGLAYALMSGRTAATTVSGTMWAAKLAGIRYFATGGIGGVHRGVERTGDISTDLLELARTPVAVVCAGVKSILDIGRTLEYLESAGVPVLGYGTEEFPAFLTAKSGHRAPYTVSDAPEAARVFRAHRRLGLPSGIVIASPPPSTGLDEATVEEATVRALREAEEHGLSGAALTPWLLARIADLTDGASLRANTALLQQNARIAAQIAVADATL